MLLQPHTSPDLTFASTLDGVGGGLSSELDLCVCVSVCERECKADFFRFCPMAERSGADCIMLLKKREIYQYFIDSELLAKL